MYLTSNSAPCGSGPLPADFGAQAAADQNALTNAIAAAQGAFNLSVIRPDLAPNGIPWQDWAKFDAFGNPLTPLGAFLSRGPYPNGVDGRLQIGPGGAGAGAGGNGNGNGGLSTNCTPQPVVLPYTSPITTADRFTPPDMLDACGGVAAGNFSPPVTLGGSPRNPGVPTPAPGVAPAPPQPRRNQLVTPTGDLCRDLQSGAVLQSQATQEQVYDCATKGWTGVGPSPLSVTQGALGMGGLDGMGGDCAPCAGNDRLTSPAAFGPSPAARARGGMGDGNGWMYALLAIGLAYVMTNGSKGK